MGDGRATVLLGAGASVAAGLPVSVDLTKSVVESLSTPWGFGHTNGAALNLAVGAMVAHDTARGRGAFDGVDVERLFSAVQALAERDDHELAPFVSSWIPGLDRLGAGRLPTGFGRKLGRAIGGNDHALESVILEGLRAYVGGAPSAPFQQLLGGMLTSLVNALRVDPGRLDYLAPLLSVSPGPIQVASLNYDSTVEDLAARAGVRLDTGVEAWRDGQDWRWDPEAAVRLLKLHGSLDWHYKAAEPAGRLPEHLVEVRAAPETTWGPGSLPVVVFGQRGKVRSEGPFLAMLRAFDEFLAASAHLVVVGYSFRDDHINRALTRWLNAHDEGRVTIVDPGLPPDHGMYDPSYSVQFRRALREPRTPATTLSFTVEPDFRNGSAVLEEGAGEGLARLFGAGPALPPYSPPPPPEPVGPGPGLG